MAKIKCPHCGRYIEITAKQGQSYQPRQRGNYRTMQNSFNSAIAGTVDTPPDTQPNYRETPTGHPSMEGFVKVPAWQAIITALGISPMVGVGVAVFGYNFYDLTPFGVVVVGCGCTIVSLFVLFNWNWLSRVTGYNSLLWKIEEFFDTDIDGDGETGKPEPRQLAVEVTDCNTIKRFSPPGDEVNAWNFASDFINGVVNFSENGAQQSGYGVAAFRELRQIFLDNGWCYWKGGKPSTAGVTLTPKGKSIMRRIAQEKPQWSDGDIGMDEVIQR